MKTNKILNKIWFFSPDIWLASRKLPQCKWHSSWNQRYICSIQCSS